MIRAFFRLIIVKALFLSALVYSDELGSDVANMQERPELHLGILGEPCSTETDQVEGTCNLGKIEFKHRGKRK